MNDEKFEELIEIERAKKNILGWITFGVYIIAIFCILCFLLKA